MSLVFSTIHHITEEHHHDDEECTATDKSEAHFHSWELEDCNLCDLQFHTNYIKTKFDGFQFVRIITKPYCDFYNEKFTSQEALSFSNKGPPVA